MKLRFSPRKSWPEYWSSTLQRIFFSVPGLTFFPTSPDVYFKGIAVLVTPPFCVTNKLMFAFSFRSYVTAMAFPSWLASTFVMLWAEAKEAVAREAAKTINNLQRIYFYGYILVFGYRHS